MPTYGNWTDTRITPLAAITLSRLGPATLEGQYDVGFHLLEEGSAFRIEMLSQDSMGERVNYGILSTITAIVLPNNFEDMRADIARMSRNPPTEVAVRCGSGSNQSAAANLTFNYSSSLYEPPNAATVAKLGLSIGWETVPYRSRMTITVAMTHSLDILELQGFARLFNQGAGWA